MVAAPMRGSLRQRLDLNRGAVRQHFGDALHHLGGIVASADHGVGAQLAGVLQHQVESLVAGLLAEIAEYRDVAADDGLQARADGAEDGARADDDSAHHAEVPLDAEARQFKSRRYSFMRYHDCRASASSGT